MDKPVLMKRIVDTKTGEIKAVILDPEHPAKCKKTVHEFNPGSDTCQCGELAPNLQSLLKSKKDS